jgi:hypothetical protein
MMGMSVGFVAALWVALTDTNQQRQTTAPLNILHTRQLRIVSSVQEFILVSVD